MTEYKAIALCVFLGCAAACTWVKPVEEAREIALVKPELAQHCKKVNAVTVKVTDSVAFINRRKAKVQEELVTMAKNEAALVGGDIIVAETEAAEGSQRFGVYNCD